MKIKVNPFFFVTAFLCCFFGNTLFFFITYVTLAVHELVHLYSLHREKIAVRAIVLEPFGICIKTDVCGRVAPRVYLSAPIFNVFLAFLFYYAAKKTDNSLFLTASAANFVLGVFNLIPVLPFDGGRAVMCAVKNKKGFVFFSFLCGIAISAAGVLWFFKSGLNFSLVMIGIFIIANSFSEREQLFTNALTESKNVLSRKITDRIDTKMITVPLDYSVHRLISRFGGDCFYMVNIISDGAVLATLPETQIISGVIAGKKFLQEFI